MKNGLYIVCEAFSRGAPRFSCARLPIMLLVFVPPRPCSAMVACPRCTFANTDDARVCKVCLCPLVEEQSAEEPTTGYSGVPCVACTFINPPGVGICGSCGTRNLTAAERAAAARAAKPGD